MLTGTGTARGRRPAVFLTALAILLVTAMPAAAAELYFKKIPLPGEGAALDINDSGQVVGTSGITGPGEAFLYDNGTTTTIHPAGWDLSVAMRISGNGTVAGFGIDGGVTKGFLRMGGVTTELLPPGWTAAQAWGVNNNGVVVGNGTVGGLQRAFGYASGFYAPFLPPGFTESRALDVNNTGLVVGSADGAAGKEAFLWEGVWRYPAPPGWTETEAVRINDRGDILGSGTEGGRSKCFLLRDGVYTTIFDPTWLFSFCSDLNELGDVSGLGFTSGGTIRSFVFRDGTFHYFDERLTTVMSGAAINDGRQLAGATTINGATAAVIASILPEADLQVKGGDGPVAVPRAAAPPVSLSLLGWTFTGRRVDWWLFAQTPAGIRSFDVRGRRWVPGLAPSASIPLRDLGTFKAPPAGSAAGPYTYYFGVDMLQNGAMDGRYFFFDRITVFLQ